MSPGRPVGRPCAAADNHGAVNRTAAIADPASMRRLILLGLALCFPLAGCAGQIGDFDQALNDGADAYVFDPIAAWEDALADAILDANDGTGLFD